MTPRVWLFIALILVLVLWVVYILLAKLIDLATWKEKQIDLFGVPITLKYLRTADVSIDKVRGSLVLSVAGTHLIDFLDCPEGVLVSYHGLRQVARKLLINSVKYTKARVGAANRHNKFIPENAVILVTSTSPEDDWIVNVIHP